MPEPHYLDPREYPRLEYSRLSPHLGDMKKNMEQMNRDREELDKDSEEVEALCSKRIMHPL